MKICLLILGMHRSGTSALGGALDRVGVFLGRELAEASEFNPKGYFESKAILEFNNRLLLPALNRKWMSVEPIEERQWESLYNTTDLVEQAKALIENEYHEAELFAIKEPRICILAPFWMRVLAELNIRVCVLLPYRPISEVASSLTRRNGFSFLHGAALWMSHLMVAEQYSREVPRIFLSYEMLLQAPVDVLRKVEKHFGLTWPRSLASSEAELSALLEPGLHHHKNTIMDYDVGLPGSVKEFAELYEKAAEEMQESPSFKQRLDVVKQHYFKDQFYFESLLACRWPEDVKLYVDSGSGFDQACAVNAHVSFGVGRSSLSLRLPDVPGRLALRFDPFPDSAVIKVEEVWLTTASGVSIDIWENMKTNAVSRELNTYFFETNNPQLRFFDIDAELLATAERFSITFCIVLHGSAARRVSRGIGRSARKLREAMGTLESLQLKAEAVEVERAQREKHLSDLEESLALCEKRLLSTSESLALCEKRLLSTNESLALSEKRLASTKERYVLREKECLEQQVRLKKMHQQVMLANSESSKLRSELSSVYMSTSWRIMRPIRCMVRTLRRVFK